MTLSQDELIKVLLGKLIRDYFPTMPRSRARIRVRYGESQEGTLEKAFQREDVCPLPTECGG